jgi:hypothetical protein
VDVSRKSPAEAGPYLLAVLAALVLATLLSALTALTGLLGINISAQSTEMSLSINPFPIAHPARSTG